MLLALYFLICALSLSLIYHELTHGIESLSYDTSQEDMKATPLVSVVIAARNEAMNLKQTLSTLKKQSYPSYEIIVVNDRSDDNSLDILTALQKEIPCLTVLNIKALPDGWLGKNYALYRGAQVANGELILFTDADVTFAPVTLAYAVAVMEENKLDNLTLMPRLDGGDFSTRMAIVAGTLSFLFQRKPWRSAQTNPNYSAGMGQFILVKSKIYWKVGGHLTVKNAVIDDMALGSVLKRAGVKQWCLDGRKYISLVWYESFKAMCNGLEKNMFAYCNFKLSKLCLLSSLGVGLFIVPLLLFAFAKLLITQLLNLLVIGMTWRCFYKVTTHCGLSGWYSIFYAYGVVAGLFIAWRAAFFNLWRGGLHWRETFYPYKQLKEYNEKY